MLDRVGCLPGAPCLLGRSTRLGGIGFYLVNVVSRAIPANRGEISRENMAVRGEFFIFIISQCYLSNRMKVSVKKSM